MPAARRLGPRICVGTLLAIGCFGGGRGEGPTVRLEATTAGAGSEQVDSATARPIVRGLKGLAGLERTRSLSGPDGACAIELEFAAGTDARAAQGLVRDRLTALRAALPAKVGPTLRIGAVSPPVAVIAVEQNGSEAKSDAEDRLEAALGRAVGVGRVVRLGRPELSVRLSLDPDRLRAFGVSAVDVRRAVETASAEGPASNDATGRLVALERLESVEVAVPAAGQSIRLRDLARTTLEMSRVSTAIVGGRPVTIFVIHATPEARAGEVLAGLRGVLERETQGPKPELALDLTRSGDESRLMCVDMEISPLMLPERTMADLARCEAIVRGTRGVERVVALSEDPFGPRRGGPCLLVRTSLSREDLAAALAKPLAEAVPDARFPIRPATTERGRYPTFVHPFTLAVRGPAGATHEEVAGQARMIVRTAAATPEVANLAVRGASAPRTDPALVLDSDAMKAKGVAASDVIEALARIWPGRIVPSLRLRPRAAGGGFDVEPDVGPWPLPGADDADAIVRGLKAETVSGAGGRAVRLSDVVAFDRRSGPETLERLDDRVVVEITGEPAPGVSAAEAFRALKGAVDVVSAPSGYERIWLRTGTAAD